MADNISSCPIPSPRLPASSGPLEGFGDYKPALAWGLVGAGAAALFVCVHWSIAIVGAMAVLVLSAMENEALLMFLIFLMPFAWHVQGHNVLLASHALVVLGFFAGRWLRGQASVSHLFRPAVSRASLCFLCAAAASVMSGKGALTPDAARAVYELATYVAFYFVVLIWANSRERIRKVMWTLLCSTGVTAAFALYQQIIGNNTLLWSYLYHPGEGYSEPWLGRSTSFLGYPTHLAIYLNLVLPMALACSVCGQGNWKKLGRWILGLGILALLSSQSLGGLLAFGAILVLAIFCFVRSHKDRLVLLAGIFASACLFYLLRVHLNPAHGENTIGPDVVMRLMLWVTAWRYFMHSPILGVGWGNFAGLYGSDLSAFSDWIPLGVFEVHNIYLQLLAETGIVGLVAFFYFIVQSWRQARRQWYSSLDVLGKVLAFGILGALISVLVHGALDVPFIAQSGTLLWVLLALLVASSRLQRSTCKSGQPE